MTCIPPSLRTPAAGGWLPPRGVADRRLTWAWVPTASWSAAAGRRSPSSSCCWPTLAWWLGRVAVRPPRRPQGRATRSCAPTRPSRPPPSTRCSPPADRGHRGRRVAPGRGDRHLRRRPHRDRALPQQRRRRARRRRRRAAGDRRAARRSSSTAGSCRPTPARSTSATSRAAGRRGHRRRLGARRRHRRQHRGRRPLDPRDLLAEIGAGHRPPGLRRLRRRRLRERPARRPASSPASCPSSTTARTSSTACSGGSSASWPSSASSTSPTTSASGVRAASASTSRTRARPATDGRRGPQKPGQAGQGPADQRARAVPAPLTDREWSRPVGRATGASSVKNWVR